MAYSTHGFTVGQRLKAAQVNEMDEQIFENYQNIAENTAFIANMDSYIQNKLNGLTIDVDSDTLYLMNGDIMLASASIPLNLDEFVPCTNVSIDDESGEITVSVGDERRFTATRVPVDTTQNLRWSVNDLNKAIVRSTGQFTALDPGQITLRVDCGKFYDSRTINIIKKIMDADHLNAPGLLMDVTTTLASRNAIMFATENSPVWGGSWPFDFDLYCLKPGRTVTVGFIDEEVSVRFEDFIIFHAIPGTTLGLTDSVYDTNRYYINNVELIAHSEKIHDKTQNEEGRWGFWGQNSYTYTNESDETYYFAFGLRDTSSTLWATADDPNAAFREWCSENISIVIS